MAIKFGFQAALDEIMPRDVTVNEAQRFMTEAFARAGAAFFRDTEEGDHEGVHASDEAYAWLEKWASLKGGAVGLLLVGQRGHCTPKVNQIAES